LLANSAAAFAAAASDATTANAVAKTKATYAIVRIPKNQSKFIRTCPHMCKNLQTCPTSPKIFKNDDEMQENPKISENVRMRPSTSGHI